MAVRYTRDERMEDLTDLHKARSARFAFYPSRATWWRKAQQLGISKEDFDRWAEHRNWFR